MDGYLALLVGQKVPHDKSYNPPPAEQAFWREHCRQLAAEAQRGMGVKEALDAIRSPGLKWA
jgi:tryptophan halogenase